MRLKNIAIGLHRLQLGCSTVQSRFAVWGPSTLPSGTILPGPSKQFKTSQIFERHDFELDYHEICSRCQNETKCITYHSIRFQRNPNPANSRGQFSLIFVFMKGWISMQTRQESFYAAGISESEISSNCSFQSTCSFWGTCSFWSAHSS